MKLYTGAYNSPPDTPKPACETLTGRVITKELIEERIGEERFGELQREYRRMTYSTDPIDMEYLRKAAAQAYTQAGLDPPQHIFVARSPVEGANATLMLEKNNVCREYDFSPDKTLYDRFKAFCQEVNIDVQYDAEAEAVEQDEIVVMFHTGRMNTMQDHNLYFALAELFDPETGGIAPMVGLLALQWACDRYWAYGEKQEHIDEAAKNGTQRPKYRSFMIVSERPKFIGIDAQMRAHGEDGPAFEYADGFCDYWWRDIRVPKAVIDPGYTVEQIIRETNQEIRRAAVEKMGWDNFIDNAGLKQIGESVDDPGNKGQTLSLYAIPGDIAEDVNVLLCTNGTVERDGTRRRYGLTVPSSIRDPLAAAAWTFGLNPDEYAKLELAT